MRIMELFYDEAGFPPGIVNLVTCSRKESELFLTDPRVKELLRNKVHILAVYFPLYCVEKNLTYFLVCAVKAANTTSMCPTPVDWQAGPTTI